MKTSITSLKKNASVFVMFFFAILLSSTSVKAQCGFSVDLLDSTGSLTFFADPGTTSIRNIQITNISAGNLTVYIQMISSTPAFQFRVIDSIRKVAPGETASIAIRFQPSLTVTGSISGKLALINSSSKCKDTINLFGIINPNLCLETEHEISYRDPVLIGSSAEHQFRLTNQSGADIFITDVNLDDSVTSGLQISSSLPLIVPAHSSNTFLNYTFSPTSNFSGSYFNTTFATVNLAGDSVGCPSITLLLIGNVAKPGGGSGIDTNVRALFPTDTRTLAIEGTGQKTTMTFKFTNNLNVVTIVNKVYLKDGTYFSIVGTNPTPTPFTLSPDQTMTATVSFNATDQSLHTDSLMIDASHNLQTTVFGLQGVQFISGVSANTLPEGVKISVSPNPSTGNVNIQSAGIRSANIQVFDLLGKEIASAKADSQWKWDTSNTVDGSYFIRISGESLTGKHFVTSNRIVISR